MITKDADQRLISSIEKKEIAGDFIYRAYLFFVGY